MHPLIEVDELAARLDDFRLVDIRWALNDPSHGRDAYIQGHIPGAVFADLDQDLSAPPGLEGRHPLPSIEAFAAVLGRLGINTETHVVTYDDANGSVAARLWWMLRSIGHPRVQLLNGGFQSWVKSKLPIELGDVAPPRGSTYPVPVRFTGVVERTELGGRILLDARAPERYRGEVEPVDPKAGHIPGAVNRPFTANLGPDGRFLPAGELLEVYQGLDNPVVSCGSGVNACHLAVAMVAAGRDMPELYPGSFSEWSRRDLPVETVH